MIGSQLLSGDAHLCSSLWKAGMELESCREGKVLIVTFDAIDPESHLKFLDCLITSEGQGIDCHLRPLYVVFISLARSL